MPPDAIAFSISKRPRTSSHTFMQWSMFLRFSKHDKLSWPVR
jgi:hypothetical protein